MSIDKEKLKKEIKKGTVKDENSLAMFLIVEKLKKEIASEVQDGKTPSENELLKLIKPLIKPTNDGKDAKAPSKRELLSIIRPLIARISVPTAREVAKLVPVPKVPEITNNIPLESPRVRDALEILQGDERLDISSINGLEKELSNIKVV